MAAHASPDRTAGEPPDRPLSARAFPGLSRPHRRSLRSPTAVLAGCFGLAITHLLASESVPPLARSQDIGVTARPGHWEREDATGTYRITGGGDNMWSTNDAFHFVWTQIRGDFRLAADVDWITTTGNPHRKACLMIRQGLEPDAAYVDAALHGDGLTSLQFREERGGVTREIQASVRGPRTLVLERDGDGFWLSLASAGGTPTPAGPAHRLRLADPLYVGLAVCAHDSNALATAQFSRVRLAPLDPAAGTNRVVTSTLEVIAVASRDRRAVYWAPDHFEAPNWSPDGRYFLFNRRGHIERLPVEGGVPTVLDTGFARRCNNDHGLSPDGRQLAISDQTKDGQSRIYVLAAGGGEPREVTPRAPSYWHGWSPDGAILAYCAERAGAYDIYTIPAAGGAETRLTTAEGLDDGPEFSPDGRFIYFNSDRTGRMQIWRMHPDGSGQEQVTHDEGNNWFPHPSPDGRWLVFLSYDPAVKGHPANQNVRLRLLPTAGGSPQEIARLFGGQGTINVPSWSPDSRQLAFVSYRLARP